MGMPKWKDMLPPKVRDMIPSIKDEKDADILMDKLLSMASPDELKMLIDNDVTLCDIMKEKVPWVFKLAKSIIRESKKDVETIFSEYNAEKLLEVLRKKRPDLAGVIMNHSNGMVWLERNIEDFKRELTE
ncbi:hypothetical protein B6U74_05395 [Candidatus Bathyarchaeota archaeon ex4484_205]|nr:MAG: hypothetical protein B6U74_05395 [Candidatus Bathyarchaeota archaeon ex4484_205]